MEEGVWEGGEVRSCLEMIRRSRSPSMLRERRSIEEEETNCYFRTTLTRPGFIMSCEERPDSDSSLSPGGGHGRRIRSVFLFRVFFYFSQPPWHPSQQDTLHIAARLCAEGMFPAEPVAVGRGGGFMLIAHAKRSYCTAALRGAVLADRFGIRGPSQGEVDGGNLRDPWGLSWRGKWGWSQGR